MGEASIGRGPRSFQPKLVRAMNKVRAAVSLQRKFLVPVWEKHVDDDSGREYFYNTVTKKSQWNKPAMFHSQPPVSPTSKRQKGFGFADPTSLLRKSLETMTDEELQEKNEKKAAAFEAMVNAAKIGNLNVLKAAVEDPELGISVNDQTIKGVTALHVASEAGQENIVEYLLEQAKADVNIRDNSRFTPMHRACSRGQLRTVYMLLQNGADFSLRTLWNETAYDIAKYRGYASICRLFEEGKFDTTELYVDRKWFKFDLHKVRHGAVHAVKVEDSHFYIKTQFINRPFDKHENLHH